MPPLLRQSFSRGWSPDVDAVNGPPDALLRGDNLILDHLGALQERPGSTSLYTTGADTDVHSLFTAVLSGTRYRMAGCTNAVYANGAAIATSLAGSNDVAFGAYLGQIFFARSTSKKKYDGSTVRTWGLSMTGGAPTAAALTPDEKTFATCDQAEAPGFTAVEGSLSWVAGQDATANGAAAVTPSATTGRGVLSKTFAADTDFTTYDGGQTGLDSDLMQLYVFVTDPSLLEQLYVYVDVNSGSANLFQDDYYVCAVDNRLPWTLDEESGSNDPLTGAERDRWEDIQDPGMAEPAPPPPASGITRPDAPVANAGWNKLLIPRKRFTRIGSTAGKDWATVKAIRVAVHTIGGGAAALTAFDAIKFIGGNQRPLTGNYRWIYCYGYNSGTYTALSAPSVASGFETMQANAARITVPADGSRDTQANEIWLFRFGGPLNQYYRVTVKTGVSGTGAVTIDDTFPNIDVVTANIPLEIDNTTPPDTILDIAGPYYDRLFALTATHLYPSRRRNPDSFASGQAIRVAGAEETAYWVKKAFGGLYIGTSRDIYVLEGDGAELPDDTVNFVLRGLNIDHPPIGNAVAQEGNNLLYLADDGWRAVAGAGSESIVGLTSLLYKGYGRHGVSAANLTTGRFRAALAKGQLTAITAEGASTTSSAVLYSRLMAENIWMRETYGRSFRSIHREPDGTLIAGDTAATVWALHDATATGDGGSALSITLWTKVDDDGRPFVRKDPANLRVYLDTGNVSATLAVHLDNSASAAISPTTTQNGLGTAVADISSIAAFTRLQLRVTVSTTSFRWESFAVDYKELPFPFRGRTPESDAGYAGEKVIAGWRVRACTLGASRTFTPYIDNVAQSTFAFTSPTDEPQTYLAQLTATAMGTDFSLGVDGDIELYEWEPIVLYRLPTKLKIWENKPMAPSPVRRRFGGLTVQIDTQGASATVTPVLDGADQATLAVTKSDLLGATLTFADVVGRDLWCRVSSATAFRAHTVEPIILETFPQKFKGRVADSNAGYAGEKVLSGLKIRCCTLGAAVTFTPILDGTNQTAVSATTGANEADTVLIQFTSPLTATDIGWSCNGDIELYDWEPLVLYQMPTRIKAWENKPLVPASTRRQFTGLVLQIHTYGANVTVTPVVDGTDGTAQTVNTADLLATVVIQNAAVGRDLWCRITGATPFSVLHVDPIITATLPQRFQGTTQRSHFGYPGVKTLSGFQFRVCTLGVARSFTPVIDGVDQTAVSVTSTADNPIDYTYTFTSPVECVEAAMTVDGAVEWYGWTPLITAKRPLGLKVWDSGPIDLGGQELVWLRELFLKVRAGANLTITPYFDGVPWPTVTGTVTVGVDSIVPVSIGRSYMGRQPRLVVRSTEPFYPYWIRCVRRTTGQGEEPPSQTIPVTVEPGVLV